MMAHASTTIMAPSTASTFFRAFPHSAYNEVIDDLWHYLRDEKGVAEPQQYLCVPMRSVCLTAEDVSYVP